MNGIDTFMHGSPESSLIPSGVGSYSGKTAAHELGSRPSSDNGQASAFVLTLPGPSVEKLICCLQTTNLVFCQKCPGG